MFGKILITAAVIYIAYLVVRARYQGSESRDDSAFPLTKAGRSFVPPGAIKMAAYSVVGVMVVGSALYLFQSWDRQHQIVDVQVVNPYNGQVQRYEARRGEIDGRSFRALDGRLIRIAEMERLIIEDRR